MNKVESAIEKGLPYVREDKIESWEFLCKSICSKNVLGDFGLEIIDDAIETMRLFQETELTVEQVIEIVGRGWNGGISSCFLEKIVTNFSKKESFSEEWINIKKESKKSIDLDDLLSKKFKR